MSKKKIEIKLSFDSEAMKGAMLMFFETYKAQLPPFLKDTLQKQEIVSDPSIRISEKEIKFGLKNTDNGAVLVYNADQTEFVTINYKLVPNDTSYIKIDANQLVIFFKRGASPDDTVGVFPDLEIAIVGLKTIEDPVMVQKRIEEIDERDAGKNEEVLGELKKVISDEKEVVDAKIEENLTNMKVIKN